MYATVIVSLSSPPFTIAIENKNRKNKKKKFKSFKNQLQQVSFIQAILEEKEVQDVVDSLGVNSIITAQIKKKENDNVMASKIIKQGDQRRFVYQHYQKPKTHRSHEIYSIIFTYKLGKELFILYSRNC